MISSFSQSEVNAHPLTAPHKVDDMLTCGLRDEGCQSSTRLLGNQPIKDQFNLCVCGREVVVVCI